MKGDLLAAATCSDVDQTSQMRTRGTPGEPPPGLSDDMEL